MTWEIIISVATGNFMYSYWCLVKRTRFYFLMFKGTDVQKGSELKLIECSTNMLSKTGENNKKRRTDENKAWCQTLDKIIQLNLSFTSPMYCVKNKCGINVNKAPDSIKMLLVSCQNIFGRWKFQVTEEITKNDIFLSLLIPNTSTPLISEHFLTPFWFPVHFTR